MQPGLREVYVDADKAQQSLLNLVVNAIKFSEPGGTIWVDAVNHDQDTVGIDVRDEGPGLPEEACANLFERFSRHGEASRRESIAGFGLGLSIVKELTGINLGEVMVESHLGEGSTFSFTLPVHRYASIVNRFVEYTKGRKPNSLVSVLSVSEHGGEAMLGRDAMLEALESVCQSTDLILPNSGENALMIMGETDDFQSFKDRLTERLKLQEEIASGLKDSSIEIRMLGQWSIGHVRVHMNQLLADQQIERGEWCEREEEAKHDQAGINR